MRRISNACLAAVLTSVCSSAFAEEVEEVLVTGVLFSQGIEGVDRPVNLLSGAALKNAAAATLGETLQNELGVSSSSFGPGVGLPVIRGQSDNRVKVMQDSVGSMDASAASPDHAITLEPLLATQIEVLRGPASLRYGTGAIGGVVNVVDNRIPQALPKDNLEGGAELRYGSGNNATDGVGTLTLGAGNVAVHLDGVKRRSGDMAVPGFAQSDQESATNPTSGFVANTDTRASAATLGTSYVGDTGFIGVSVNTLDNNYGVPPDSAELVRIDMHQTRIDVKGEKRAPFVGVEKISGHLGQNDYRHTEMEDGAPGTQFTNHAYEGRMEALHDAMYGWRGALGVQIAQSTFAAVGEEAFIPKSDIHNNGLFITESREFERVHCEWGARVDRQSIAPDTARKIHHDSVNLSASGSWRFVENQKLLLGLARSQRSPSVEELLANGPHPATGSYLTGNIHLANETSVNSEFGYQGEFGHWQTSLNIYRNQIANFIYANNENETVDDLTLYQYGQADAVFQGYEAELKYAFNDGTALRVFSDQVVAKLTNGDNLPRITPARVGASAEFTHSRWHAGLSMSHAARQNHPGPFENPTASSNRIDASIDYKFSKRSGDYTAFFKASNLLDAEIRNPTSYLRDIAPEAGRNLQVGVRVKF